MFMCYNFQVVQKIVRLQRISYALRLPAPKNMLGQMVNEKFILKNSITIDL
jgi:hypothetical protein